MIKLQDKIEIIQGAIQTISAPEYWNAGCWGVDRSNFGVDMSYDGLVRRAISWCAMGAIAKNTLLRFPYGTREASILVNEVAAFCRQHFLKTLSALNDEEGREKALEVLTVFLKHLQETS